MRRLTRIAIRVAGATAIAALACGGVQVHRQARVRSLSAKAEAAAHPLVFECRWERPVIGGAARDCSRSRHGAFGQRLGEADHGRTSPSSC